MIKIEQSVTIKRPVEEVFEYMANPENEPQWVSEIVESKRTSESPIEVGSTWAGVVQFMGRRIESTYEVTEYQANNKFGFKSTSGPIPVEAEYNLESVAEGETKVTFLAEADVGGFFKLAEPLVSRSVKRQWKTNVANLKDLMESQA